MCVCVCVFFFFLGGGGGVFRIISGILGLGLGFKVEDVSG